MSKHTDLDIRMKSFEAYKDNMVLPENYILVRLDGVGFSNLTKRIECKKPFDNDFMLSMVNTTKYLLEQVPDIDIGYTQSDEITLVFKRDTGFFARRPEKLTSVLAGMASSAMSAYLQNPAVFDARVIVLPNKDLVNQNLAWRIEDSVKNCRNLYVYWNLIQEAELTPDVVQTLMHGRDAAWQNNLLYESFGINFNNIQNDHKRGTLLYRVKSTKTGFNPISGNPELAIRSSVFIDRSIPDVRAVSVLDWIEQSQS